jgi:hypothetical protein
VAENDSNDIREETASKESHHDGIYKGEVPSWIRLYLLLTLNPNMRVISSWGNRLHQMYIMAIW